MRRAFAVDAERLLERGGLGRNIKIEIIAFRKALLCSWGGKTTKKKIVTFMEP